MVTDIIFSAFADEMQKIANLGKYVQKAKGGNYMKALGGLAADPKAVQEATTRFHTLKRRGDLPASLMSAPVPLSEPKGFIAKTKSQAALLSWLKKNKGKPGFMEDARKALDAAMDLKL